MICPRSHSSQVQRASAGTCSLPVPPAQPQGALGHSALPPPTAGTGCHHIVALSYASSLVLISLKQRRMGLKVTSDPPCPFLQASNLCTRRNVSYRPPGVLFSSELAGWIIGRFPSQLIFSPSWQLAKHLVRALIPGQRRLPALSLW